MLDPSSVQGAADGAELPQECQAAGELWGQSSSHATGELIAFAPGTHAKPRS